MVQIELFKLVGWICTGPTFTGQTSLIWLKLVKLIWLSQADSSPQKIILIVIGCMVSANFPVCFICFANSCRYDRDCFSNISKKDCLYKYWPNLILEWYLLNFVHSTTRGTLFCLKCVSCLCSSTYCLFHMWSSSSWL